MTTANTSHSRQELARLLALWPSEVADQSAFGHARIVGLLIRAIRQEHTRGIMADWTYCLPRHAALCRHLKREIAELNALLNHT